MPNGNKKASLLLQPAPFSDPQTPWKVVARKREKQGQRSTTKEGITAAPPPPQEKPALRGEQLARLLLQLGTKLCTTHLSAVNPVEKTGAPPAAPKKMEGMSTEALTSALATLGFPDVLIKPFRDAIEEM